MLPESPLALPAADSPPLLAFLAHFGLLEARGTWPPAALAAAVGRAFSRIPYENLTKILALAAAGKPERARRGPAQVVAEHRAFGAGGTCFSLTAAMLHILRALGLRAEPILADRHYGPDTHCALVLELEGEPHLLDPGFLIVDPLPLRGGERRVPTRFNELLLTPTAGGERLELSTLSGASRTRRLTWKLSPCDEGEFLRAWDASFGWDMMRYPVLSRVDEELGSQLYLQGSRLQLRRREGVERRELSREELAAEIARRFGLAPGLAAKALEALERTGERRGAAASR